MCLNSNFEEASSNLKHKLDEVYSLDSTHNISKYLLMIKYFILFRTKFKLTTLLAKSDFGAIPLIQMISMRETKTELGLFFEKSTEWFKIKPKAIVGLV